MITAGHAKPPWPITPHSLGLVTSRAAVPPASPRSTSIIVPSHRISFKLEHELLAVSSRR